MVTRETLAENLINWKIEEGVEQDAEEVQIPQWTDGRKELDRWCRRGAKRINPTISFRCDTEPNIPFKWFSRFLRIHPSVFHIERHSFRCYTSSTTLFCDSRVSCYLSYRNRSILTIFNSCKGSSSSCFRLKKQSFSTNIFYSLLSERG